MGAILAYANGWSGARLRAYVARKGWRASRIGDGASATVGRVDDVSAHSEAHAMNTPNPNQNPNQNPQNPNDPTQPQRGPGGTPAPGQNPNDPSRRPDEREDDADARPSRR